MTKALTIYIEGPIEIRLGFVETVRLTIHVLRYHALPHERLSRQDIQQLVTKEALRRRGIREIEEIDDVT
jgi:hypothetical protein